MFSASLRLTVLAALVLQLTGCATAPVSPHVAVYPGTGKSFDEFRADDIVCRQYASDQTGGANAAQAANNSAVASGVIGTLIGAAAGAAIGGRDSAAIGAGTGLIVGSAAGANSAQYSAYGTQRRYDISYQQCMYAKGNSIPGMAPRRAAYPPSGYRSAPPGYMPPPPNMPPPGQN
jgi:hypothetical protein